MLGDIPHVKRLGNTLLILAGNGNKTITPTCVLMYVTTVVDRFSTCINNSSGKLN
jgi:hypothetical protein